MDLRITRQTSLLLIHYTNLGYQEQEEIHARHKHNNYNISYLQEAEGTVLSSHRMQHFMCKNRMKVDLHAKKEGFNIGTQKRLICGS